MLKPTVVVIIFLMIVSIIASVSVGYLVGKGQSQSFQSAVVSPNQTRTVTTTFTNVSPAPVSMPIEPSPFEYSFVFKGDSVTWYVPIVLIGEGTTSQLYVNYDCDGPCRSPDSSISSLGIAPVVPQSYSISESGNATSTSNVSFTSGSVVKLENTSETILYTVSVSSTGAGYYTFSTPFGCTPGPILYVKVPSSASNYTPIANWLQSIKASRANLSTSVG